MITLNDFFETIEYKVTEGNKFQWQCFGPNAFVIAYDADNCSLNITFDTKTQEVFCVEACDYTFNRAYRTINPLYKEQYFNEVASRLVQDTAWDDVGFFDLATDEDMLKKLKAIYLNQDYDTHISVPVDLPDDILLQLMIMAHEQDVTFNHFVNNIIRTQLMNT